MCLQFSAQYRKNIYVIECDLQNCFVVSISNVLVLLQIDEGLRIALSQNPVIEEIEKTKKCFQPVDSGRIVHGDARTQIMR